MIKWDSFLLAIQLVKIQELSKSLRNFPDDLQETLSWVHQAHNDKSCVSSKLNEETFKSSILHRNTQLFRAGDNNFLQIGI